MKHPMKFRHKKTHQLIFFSLLGILLLAGFVFGRECLVMPEQTLMTFLHAGYAPVWNLPLTILVFFISSFLGIPQWLLITTAIIAFGAKYGALYSWLATLVTAAIHFALGRRFGRHWLIRFEYQKFRTVIRFIQMNGFVSSCIVRCVPSGPFILVNFVASMVGINFLAFFAGTALGIIPKIAMLALFGQGVTELVNTHGGFWKGTYFFIIWATISLCLWLACKCFKNLHRTSIVDESDKDS